MHLDWDLAFWSDKTGDHSIKAGFTVLVENWYRYLNVYYMLRYIHVCYFHRTTLYLPNGWPFVLVCALLRFVEGIGIALFNTAATFLFVQAYPDSVGLMVVRILYDTYTA